jgi:hypothetical protein
VPGAGRVDAGQFKPGSFFVEPHLELALRRQLELVARHEYVLIACGREAHHLGVTFCAEQNSNGRILLRIRNMLGQMINVKSKLSRMLRLKRSHLEIDGDEAAQPTMEEKQVDVMMTSPRGDAKLPGDEAEITAEFEQKLLKMIDKSALQKRFLPSLRGVQFPRTRRRKGPEAVRPGTRPRRRPGQASKPHRACH